MYNEGKTIYKTARKTTEFTQEDAADSLFRSLQSIQDYEQGRTIPPDDVVCDMARLYNTPWLAYLHLKTNNPAGFEHLPLIESRSLSKGILNLRVELHHLSKILHELEEIAKDDLVDDNEQPTWQNGMNQLDNLLTAALSIKFISLKAKPPARGRRVL